jgi:hypothetical protein
LTNAEGFLGIVIAIELAAGLIGCVIAAIVFFVLDKIKNRPLRLFVLLAGMAASLMYVGRGDAPMMLTLALAFGIPLAVLVPPLCFPERIGGSRGISGIMKCYAVVWIIGAILPLLFVASGLSMIPFIFWHSPFSNGVIFICLMVWNVVLATAIYRIFDWMKRRKPTG